jgi:hypothetical protein
MIAILAGMATAAAFVLLQSLRMAHDPIKSTAAGPAVASAKPSAFGAPIKHSATPPDATLSAAQIAKAGSGAIMTVIGYDQNDKPITQGVGYVYSASGIIATTYGAIKGASSVIVETPAGDDLNVIALMGYNQVQDLAVLAVLEGSLPTLETGSGEVVQEGDTVVTLGSGNAVSQGAVGSRRAMGGVDLFQVTASGAAGSPVLNVHGKVIGLVTHRSLAIPSHYISDLLAERRVLSFGQMLEETSR